MSTAMGGMLHGRARTMFVSAGVVTALFAALVHTIARMRRAAQWWWWWHTLTSSSSSAPWPLNILRARDTDEALALSRTMDAAAEPRAATQAALDAIRDGRIATLGGLVYFLRGQPTAPFGAAGGDGKVRHEHRLGIPFTLVQFLQESYLPATRKSGNEDGCACVERAMFEQLVQASNTLRRLEVERATAFDDGNYGHVNLLQQLWAAAGRPANTFVRHSPLWTELGFQDGDPATDLRSGGVFALRQLVDFAQTHTGAFRDAMASNARRQSAGADTWYMLAVVSIQLSVQLLLQREFALARSHLEVVYDTVHMPVDAGNGNSSNSSSGSSGSKTPVLSRAALALRVYHTTLTACVDRAKPGKRNTRLADEAATQHSRSRRSPQAGEASGGASAGGDMGGDTNGGDEGDDAAVAALAQVWRQPCDVEAGLNMLHHALLLHFMQCWERDEPHVSEYHTYIAEHVFRTFFTPSWSLPTAAASS